MDPTLSLVILYAVGIAMLVAEIFLPSHAVLTVCGLGLLGWAVYHTFQLSEFAGYFSLVLLAIILPTMMIIAVRTWHQTPIGRRISPPNPVLTQEDAGARPDLLEPFVGQIGTTLTPLRPVGKCRFGDRKIECVSESEMIGRGVTVQAIGIVNMSLAVRPVEKNDRAMS
jgi:membrane-bound serine protease (ClpP class)